MAAISEMTDKKADLKILTLHWGNEYIHRPSMTQRNMAYKLIDARGGYYSRTPFSCHSAL